MPSNPPLFESVSSFGLGVDWNLLITTLNTDWAGERKSWISDEGSVYVPLLEFTPRIPYTKS